MKVNLKEPTRIQLNDSDITESDTVNLKEPQSIHNVVDRGNVLPVMMATIRHNIKFPAPGLLVYHVSLFLRLDKSVPVIRLSYNAAFPVFPMHGAHLQQQLRHHSQQECVPLAAAATAATIHDSLPATATEAMIAANLEDLGSDPPRNDPKSKAAPNVIPNDISCGFDEDQSIA